MLKKIETLVQSQGHCVLATCAVGAPHTSLMSYCATPDAREFYLATRTDTHKYRNLLANPRASLLIDDRGGALPGAEAGLALTVTARLAAFATPSDEAAAHRALVARHPRLAAFFEPGQVVVMRLVAVRLQLLSGLTETFLVELEKNA